MPGRPEPARYGLQVDPSRQGQRIIQTNAEITHSAVHLGMAEQQLDCAQVADLFVNLDNLGALHRMGAKGAWLQPDREQPVAQDPGTLPRGQVRTGVQAAWPKILTTDHFKILDPSPRWQARGFGDLEAHRLVRLA